MSRLITLASHAAFATRHNDPALRDLRVYLMNATPADLDDDDFTELLSLADQEYGWSDDIACLANDLLSEIRNGEA